MSFSVQIEPSGHTFSVEDNETLLDAALKNDIGLPYGCRNGLCGSCICKLQAGEVEYPEGKPAPLADEADDAILSCKAIPKGDLVIFSAEVEKAEEIEIITMPCKVAKIEHLPLWKYRAGEDAKKPRCPYFVEH